MWFILKGAQTQSFGGLCQLNKQCKCATEVKKALTWEPTRYGLKWDSMLHLCFGIGLQLRPRQ